MPNFTEKYLTSLEKIEEFVHRLLFWEFEGLNDLWTMQLKVMYLILELQQEITRLKTENDEIREQIKRTVSNKDGDWKSTTAELNRTLHEIDDGIRLLQRARGMARRVGDSLVWLWLNYDTSIIAPLSSGTKSSVPEGIGLTGMAGIATLLANEGVGFPLLHDATGILRIGDITFVNPGKKPTTVEIKTRDTGTTEHSRNFLVRIAAIDQSDEFKEVLTRITAQLFPSNQDSAETPSTPPRIRNTQGDRRITRQIERMRAAAKSHEPGPIDEDTGNELVVFEIAGHSAVLSEKTGHKKAGC